MRLFFTLRYLLYLTHKQLGKSTLRNRKPHTIDDHYCQMLFSIVSHRCRGRHRYRCCCCYILCP